MMKVLKSPHLVKVIKFGLVGLMATFVHAGTFQVLYVSFETPHLWANLLGFSLGFVVSYFGQFRWTFSEESALVSSQRAAFFRFARVAFLGLALNLIWAQLILDWWHLHHFFYLLALLFVTPTVVFLLTKFWVMRT